jgi:hypothetical protein
MDGFIQFGKLKDSNHFHPRCPIYPWMMRKG